MRKTLTSLALFCLSSLAAPAQDLGDIVKAGMLTGWREASGAHMAAIRLELAPGWKTYWRAPGDAGIPPTFDWTGSRNLRSFATHWPVPVLFDTNGFRSVGYDGEVTIPISFVPEDAGAPILISGEMQIGVCRDICVPMRLDLRAELPATGQGAGSDLVRAALADRPLTEAEAGVGLVVCRTEPISDGLRITVVAELPRIAEAEESVVEFVDPTVWVSEAETTRDGDRLTAVAEMVPPEARPFAMARDGVRLTVLGAGRAVDIRGCKAG